MQAVAFLGVLIIFAGNILFFVLPVLFAVVGTIAEEFINLFMGARGRLAHLR